LVEDNGKGFDVNNVLSSKGMGLKSIESRVNYLAGKLNYDSSPSHGTTVNIEIPL
jgi:two-component system, NarL family, sensor kinase